MKMTIKEASAHMGVSQEFVRESIIQGKLKGAYYIKRRGRKTFYIDKDAFLNGLKGE